MRYKFTLSPRGRQKLKNDLGQAMASIVAKKLERMGWGSGYSAMAIAGQMVTVPDTMIEEFNMKLNENFLPLLEEFLQAETITSISVHIEGNRGTMKCLNRTGKLLVQYEVTSGEMEIDIWETTKNIVKNFMADLGTSSNREELLIHWDTESDYTLKDLGPIPPGTYSFQPIDTSTIKEVGMECTIEIDEKNITDVKMIDSETISISVQFAQGKRKWLPYVAAVLNNFDAEEGDWGTHRIQLHPVKGTRTFGRDGFYLHGGDKPGSHGCIDIGEKMSDFVDSLMLGDPNRTIEVTVTNSNTYDR